MGFFEKMVTEAERRNKEDGSDESSRWSFNSRSSSGLSSPAPQVDWLIRKPSVDLDVKLKPPPSVDEQGSEASESEMMKERFSKLLLGEDMSGSGKGVCTALAISNAITNLYATVFGQLWRLEPLPPEKKSMWRREMEWFLCVSDYIVELIPAWHKLPDGDRVEIMSSRQRLDLVMNLPALRKLDNMLLEILDGFTDPEFWYVDQGIAAPETRKSVSFRKAMERQEGKWWLPVPRVPPNCLTEGTRNHLTHKLECANQILKAVSAINSSVLADMEVPNSYSENLPKSGKTCLGNVIHRYITSEKFSSDCLLDCLDISSEHAALEMANRVESAIYVWVRKLRPKHSTNESCSSKSSWEIVRDLVQDGDKRGLLVERAENLLLSIKQRFPGLTQTSLDSCKIHCNKDIGKSILESYSRVLESLAFSIIARIEDLLYVDDINKHKPLSVTSSIPPPVSFPVPISGTNRTAYATPIFSPAGGEKMPIQVGNCDKPTIRVLGPKRVVVNYISGDDDVKDSEPPKPNSRGTIEGKLPKESSSSVVNEKRRQSLDRYFMYSSMK